MNPENLKEGHIRLHRSLQKKGYYQNSEYIHLWVHLLLCATYKEKEYLFNGKIHKLLPGQFITGRNSISKDTGIHRSKVERALTMFESEHQIEQQKNNKFRIITICNWHLYQVTEHQNEQQMSIQRASSEHLVSTINKEKKEKNTKPPELPDWLDKELWEEWLAHRKKLRKPMTNFAQTLLIRKLVWHKDRGQNPVHLLQEAMVKGWLDVYEPK